MVILTLTFPMEIKFRNQLLLIRTLGKQSSSTSIEITKLNQGTCFSTSVPIILGQSISFIIYSPAYAMDIIKTVQLKWHYTTPFCFRCHNSTCIEGLSITHLKSING